MNQKNWLKNFGQTPRPCTETLCLSDFWSSNPAKGETYSSDTTLRELIASVATKKEWATSAATQTRVTVSRSRNQATVETWWNQAKGCGKPELRGVETTCTSKNENSFHPKPCVPAHFCVQYLIAWKSCPRNSCSVKRGSHQYIFYQKKLITLHPLSSALWYRKKCLDFFSCVLSLQHTVIKQDKKKWSRSSNGGIYILWAEFFLAKDFPLAQKKAAPCFFPRKFPPGKTMSYTELLGVSASGVRALGVLDFRSTVRGARWKRVQRPWGQGLSASARPGKLWATFFGRPGRDAMSSIYVWVLCAFMKM